MECATVESTVKTAWNELLNPLGDVRVIVEVDDFDAELLNSILKTEGYAVDSNDALGTFELAPSVTPVSWTQW